MHSISVLKKQLRCQEIKKIILEHVLCAIKEFEHYKQVNKRFTDYLEETYPDIMCWITRDGEYTHFKARWVDYDEQCNDRPYIEIRVYSEPLTWSRMKERLEQYNINHEIQRTKDKMGCFDEDMEAIKDLHAYVKGIKTQNFEYELRKILHELEDILRYGSKS